MNLPQEFMKRMQKMLGQDATDFFASYEKGKHQGLRVNTLKLKPQNFTDFVEWDLDSIPWATGGFYYQGNLRPAKHPYYHAGLYYIQEPSAMAPAEVLNPQPGEKILDLCAAPGGKTTQLAGLMKGQGVLVANDNNPQRVKALVKNIERYGVTHAIVTGETPDRLARVFHSYFDGILVDAPCSGEGMFRKEPDMVKDWSEDLIRTCCTMQLEILEEAARMLKPGGRLVYSTCTFAPEENEEQIEKFLSAHPEFEMLPLPHYPGWKGGRLWPHLVRGEGHFLALLRKKEDQAADGLLRPTKEKENGKKGKIPEEFSDFIKEVLPGWTGWEKSGANLTFHEDMVFLTPRDLPSLKGLRIARQGWFLGSVKKKRFDPSQAFAMGITREMASRVTDLGSSEEDVLRYLRGETLLRQAESGWQLVCVDGFPLGWAKGAGSMIKNMYPAGWRWIDGH